MDQRAISHGRNAARESDIIAAIEYQGAGMDRDIAAQAKRALGAAIADLQRGAIGSGAVDGYAARNEIVVVDDPGAAVRYRHVTVEAAFTGDGLRIRAHASCCAGQGQRGIRAYADVEVAADGTAGRQQDGVVRVLAQFHITDDGDRKSVAEGKRVDL